MDHSDTNSEQGSPHSGRSGSGSPQSYASGSPPGSPHSGESGSPPGSPRSVGSGSVSGSHRSGGSRSPSGSPRGIESQHSVRSRSHSNSPRSHHSGSRSGSPASQHSGSHRSRSGSPEGSHRSRSGTPRSRSRSPRSRSRSASLNSGSASPKRPDSDSEDEMRKKPKKHPVASDDESGSELGKGTATMDSLFGNASDISSESDEEKEMDQDEDDVQRRGGSPRDVNDEDSVPEEQPETRIDVEFPKITTDLGKAIHLVKLPNFLSVETRPFDENTYEDEIDEDEVLDEEGRTRMKLKVENTMRWRALRDEEGNELKNDEGKTLKESNARVVRWSDGSMSLHLGNEVFDIHTMLQGDHNHLFIRQGTGLQGQTVFKTKLSFRPHSTDSFTHRKMTMSLADRSSKTQKIRVLPIAGKDPESRRSEMIKKEEERLRASIRRESQQRRMKERASHRGINRSYLEDEEVEDEEGAVSVMALKNKYKPGSGKKDPRRNIYSSDSEDSMDAEKEAIQSRKLMKAKKLDSDEEDGDSDVERKRAKVMSDEEQDQSRDNPDISDDDL